jgi:hypothetical protein
MLAVEQNRANVAPDLHAREDSAFDLARNTGCQLGTWEDTDVERCAAEASTTCPTRA